MINACILRVSRAAAVFAFLGLYAPRTPLALGVRSIMAQDTVRVASPLLLKRLGEALDGYRTGAVAYVVASYDYPNTVAGIYDTQPEAAKALKELGRSYAVFGPYQTGKDLDLSPRMVVCKHIMSLMEPQSYCNGVAALKDVDSVTISIWLKNRETRREVLPAGTDAVFFTLAAVDKFALPYYARAIGIDEAARMRQDLVKKMRSR